MAITIETTPQDYAPVYNPLIVVASSTNSGNTDFSYIFEICDSSGTTLRTLRIPPEILYAYGVSDVARVLESYVNEDGASDFFLVNGTGDTRDCDNSFYDYQIKIGEEYDVSGTLTQFLNLGSFTATALNGSLAELPFINWDYTDYDLDGTSKLFLTDTIDKEVLLTGEGYTNFLNTSTVTNFRVQTYDSTGSIIKDVEFLNSSTSTVGQFASSPASLNAVTLSVGLQPVVDSSTAYYEIFAENGGSQVSTKFRYNVKSDCGDGVVVHFKNDLGGFDSFPFITYKERFDIKREKYKQNPNRLDAAGGYTYSTLDREQVQYHTKRTKRVRMNTDLLTDEQSVWLRQLVDSPEVYIAYEGNTYSVLLTATNYDVKEYDYNDMFQLEIDVEFSIEEYRQRY